MRHRRFRPLWLVLGILQTLALPAGVPAATDAKTVYDALRAARPTGKALTVSDLTLERDVFRFHFDAGSFQFLPPIEGRVVGAVFAGRGTLELRPASAMELQHLRLVTAEKSLEVLSDSFESLVLLFTDATAAEIEGHGSPAAAPSPRSAEIFESFLKTQRKDLKTNLQIRLLQSLLGDPAASTPAFLAYEAGKKYPASLVAVDAGGLDWLFGNLGGESSALSTVEGPDSSLWYCSRSKGDVAVNHVPDLRPVARAASYEIDTTIRRNEDISGVTTIRGEVLTENLRLLPLHLLGKLRLKEVSFAPEKSEDLSPAAFIQENEKEDADAAILFPSPLQRGPFRIQLRYEGSGVLQDAGDGNFLVGARESWYPNLGTFSDVAAYDLTYRFPKANEVVSVGTRKEERTDGDTKVSTWKQEHPVRVAGFNYGKFKKLERSEEQSPLKVSVYTSPGNGFPGVDPDSLADSAMADGINTSRIATAWFGGLPEHHLSITQQRQFFFGQSWPTLIYLPSILGVDATLRRGLGLDGIGARAEGRREISEFVEEVAPHEVAHQWWGHLVGWRGYRDQWLSEGFAQFSASLVLESAGGPAKFHQFWERSRQWILKQPRGSAVPNDAAGPIAEGWRLATRRSPDAYDAMVYAKGAYVLHMLRMQMRDWKSSQPDEKFIGMMKDFAATYAGKNPSTRDFQAVVERHMVPSLNLAGDGKMDWFFRQWVDGVDIPRLSSQISITKAPDNQYHFTGSISQDAVPQDFKTAVHLYVEFGKGDMAHLGVLTLGGVMTSPLDVTLKLSKEPKRALLNAQHEVLSRD